MRQRLFPVMIALGLAAAPIPALAAPPASAPAMVAETDWLRLPENLRMGDVSAVAVDSRDSVWILHRPGTLAEADRPRAAPPVVRFDRDGRYLGGFGGPGAGYEWPTVEHSLTVDRRGNVWISGNFRGEGKPADDMVLEFRGEGRFVKQIGRRGASTGDRDTANLHAPADIFVDDAAGEVYIADGYGNRRIIVFDRGSGAFKRMWSAFGAPPPLEAAPAVRPEGAAVSPETGEGPPGFNGVHGVEIARDGLVYVADRNNHRIQLFTRRGKYLRQLFVDRDLPSAQTASGIAFSPDRNQRYMYVSDWGNGRLLIYDRMKLELLHSLGGKGTAPGQFLGPHLIATDSRGVLYVAEVQGRRVQRFTLRR